MSLTERLEIAVVFLVTSAVASFGQDVGLTRADAAFVQAAVNHDQVTLKKLVDADFTWTNADGAVQTRSRVLQELPKIVIPSEKDAESRVFTYGDLADVQVNQGRFHVLRVWVKRSGDWKAIVYQEVVSHRFTADVHAGCWKGMRQPVQKHPVHSAEQYGAASGARVLEAGNCCPRPQLRGVRPDGGG
jgi:hypothetical protein